MSQNYTSAFPILEIPPQLPFSDVRSAAPLQQYILTFQSHLLVSTHYCLLFHHGTDYYFPSEISWYDHEDDKTDLGKEKEIIPEPI